MSARYPGDVGIEGFRGGMACLTRMHHCIADGIALARVMLALTDGGPAEPEGFSGSSGGGLPLGTLARAAGAQADTSDVTWQNRVVVQKNGDHCRDDPNCFNRYHFAIEPVARAKPGDHVVFHTRDALDTDLDWVRMHTRLTTRADQYAIADVGEIGIVHVSPVAHPCSQVHRRRVRAQNAVAEPAHEGVHDHEWVQLCGIYREHIRTTIPPA